ncbi:MAG: fg-gap repeat protein [Sediminibacterium sp.]|nr:fg-gap repeat protein [Sediminibacterium sp.]
MLTARKYFLFYIILLSASACHPSADKLPDVFEVLDSSRTGLMFSNKLTPTQQFNMFKYMYFYNGGGVGAGDFNNDGLIDIFMSANQGDNKLYLNKGNLSFKDVTTEAKIPQDGAWSTGVSVVDINNDGLLDIYVCRVGQFETLHGNNQLLICQGIDKNGIPQYKDEAKKYGLDFSGFSTQAVFVDYDMDGDLDLFLLNHSVHRNGAFAPRKNFIGTYDVLSGDRIFRNDGETFTDVTKQTGINSSSISYGLGVSVADINLDGYPDIYVGNDFHENDYLYINQKNGTFKEELNDRIMHTSQFSMGVDVADVNNDGYPEIISMDMLPSDPYILKRSLGEDEFDIFQYKITAGYNYQYTRNNLQLNRRNGMFSEVGLYSGIYATDWSWAALWMDFDNDGLKDLFISNGIPKRMNEMDYVNFISNEEIQKKIASNSMEDKDMALVNKIPEIKIPNKLYRNAGDLKFNDLKDQIGNDKATYSNGAVYADLDNDGDLDVVVNNINEAATIYKNNSNDKNDKAFAEIKLKGPEKNINAVGAKVILFANGGIRTYEKNPVRGFQSSMEVPIHIGLDYSKVDSAFLVWPDNTYQTIQFTSGKKQMAFAYAKGLPVFNYSKITNYWPAATRPMQDITKESALNYKHEENAFPEFDREPLMPHMLSGEGPALCVADIDHDGLEDVFIGSARDKKSVVFLQKANGKFIRTAQPSIEADSSFEDVDATWADVNNDGHLDLVVASGGNEFFGPDEHLKPRVYLNNGKAGFTKLVDAFDSVYLNASCVIPYDFNGDGAIDLFIGARDIPWEYGSDPRSYLLQNDGKGHFKDVTASHAKELANIGMVTQANWFDIDKDGDKDLLICTEWNGIYAWINDHGNFTKKILTNKKGWWNFLLPVDIDNDGDIDLIAGNLGLNSRLKADEKEPVKLYYNDFDDNGRKEQVLTYFLDGREILFANKDELQKQVPMIKKKFLYAEEFAKADLAKIFGAEKLEKSKLLTANYFSNAVLINQGNLNFTIQALPWEAQLSSFRDAVVIDANNDNLPDILMMGNYYKNNIQMGRYDADFGTLLVNKGKGSFSAEPINGLQVKGEVRHIRSIMINHKPAFVLARNNDDVVVITFRDEKIVKK